MKIAIVGMAFRLPGDLSTEADFWEALRQSRNLVGTVPPERWGTDVYVHSRRAEPGRSISFAAGLLSRIDEFDASFFGISPREAKMLDPQQRLLLEMTWEALENGGQVPARLAGSDCAVYIGISGLDYGLRCIDDLSAIDAYSMTGNTLSVAANRISYVFDLHGPSLAVDTACSSSLVALHHACQSLRNGEVSTAIAGGVNLLLHPYPFVGFTKASMLSADGRCKTFDARGDGYVRAEGGGILFLKPLAQALADGDPVQAVILASGVNTDGYKSGLTIPSSAAQASLMQSVCRQAALQPADIVYVEAHGTGTAVGDPIETAAIGQAIGRAGERAQPLYVGSVKSNMGHLEPASGMAGLVKTVLCLKHRALPASLHLETPNPNIDFAALNLIPVTAFTPLPDDGTPLRMGVNSFGFGGANAHVVLENFASGSAASPVAAEAPAEPPPLFLSARHRDALKQLAIRYADLVANTPAESYYDIAHSAAFRRQRLERGLAVFGSGPAQIEARLRRFAGGEAEAGVVEEERVANDARVAFVYSGNGAQWAGMGRRLMAESPLFLQSIEETDALFTPLAGFSLLDELLREPAQARLHLTEVAQPTLFAIQVAMTRLLAAYGLAADAACGHSVGEVAAAWATGAISLEQAVEVIYERSAAQGTTRGAGRMAAVGLAPERMLEALAASGLASRVEIAGINSPNSVTVSGNLEDLEALGMELGSAGTFFRLLDLEYAFHSRYMEPLHGRLLHQLAGLTPVAGHGRFVSTVTGAALDGERLDAAYWWRNIREPVQFAQAIETLAREGCGVFVEISPHAILQRYLGECFSALKSNCRAIAIQRRDTEGLDRLRETAYRAFLMGCPLCLDPLFPGRGACVPLPNYPWQRERLWYSPSGEGYDLINRHRVHPLLGYRLKDGEAVWENQLDPQTLPYLRDHVVGGAMVLPAAAYVELALAASAQVHQSATHEIEDLEIQLPILLDEAHARTVRFELSPGDGRFKVKSRVRLSDEPWTVNAVGRLLGATLASPPAPLSVAEMQAAATERLDAGSHYRLCSRMGLEYGPAFQGFEEGWLEPAGGGLLTRIRPPPSPAADATTQLLHPALLDACFQSLLALFREDVEAGRGATFLPVRVGRLNYFGRGQAVRYCRTRLSKHNPHSVLADFALLDGKGEVLARLEGCRFRAAPIALPGHHQAAEWVYTARVRNRPEPEMPAPLPGTMELLTLAASVLEQEEGALRRADHFQRAVPLFDALVGAFVHRACRGCADARGRLAPAFLAQTGSGSEWQNQFRAWMLAILEEDGVLERTAAGWRFIDEDPVPPEDIWLSILGDDPAYMPDLVLAGRVGTHLRELLSGQRERSALANGIRASVLVEQLLEASPTHRGMNRAVEALITGVVASWPANRRLRILEVGNGSRALTRRILPLLPSERCDYVIAEGDEDALARAEAEFAEHGEVGFIPLHPDTLLAQDEDAFGDGFDLILAAHVVHGTAEPLIALSALKRMLSKGGLLFLLERYPDRLTDFTFGLHDAWWARRGSRLLEPERWRHLLEEGGYVDIESLVEPIAARIGAGPYVLLARNPEARESKRQAPEAAHWLLLVDADGESHEFVQALGERLTALGQSVSVAKAEGELPALDPFHHVVQLAGLSLRDDGPGLDLIGVQDRRCGTTLELVHAIETGHRPARPRLWLVTGRGALASLPDGTPGSGFPIPSQATLWGFGRVLMNEHPELQCTLIDLQQDVLDAPGADALCQELLYPDGEDEIILVRNGRLVTRMQRAPRRRAAANDEDSLVRLDFSIAGQLRNLQWRAAPLPTLAEDAIEVQPLAVGLNFRDVMYAMGLLSDEAVENGFAGPSMGMELSGVVTRVGSGVAHHRPGDAVIAFAPAAFASRTVTKAGFVVPKPPVWSFEEAATIPTVFFTAYYALHYLARVQPGEKVLIHGAAGGVGIAAIQLARYLGAEVFATAGSEEKRDFVRLLGADHVMNSRKLAFADEILQMTGGRGVDVVLNSLAGEAINRNLRVLRPFGRFLELGKRDFYENTHIGLRPFKDNITYYGIDADQLMVERPELAAGLFREMMELFEQGVLKPLPYRAFPAATIGDAFRYMQQSKQIGKIVVSFAQGVPPAVAARRAAKPLTLSRNATYLVSGGVGGFGLRTARWLAEQGAGHIVLLGRRGTESPEVEAAVAMLHAAGAAAHVKACDVTDARRLAAVLEQIGRELPPLKGIVHAAAVIDDGLIRNLDRNRFHAVTRPKVLGAWNLHGLTAHLPLDFFVLYSSATTFFGNPGQANYVAANLYLEALAAYRRARGLVATSVSWGAIRDVGYLARHEEVKDALQSRLGGAALSSEDALEHLGRELAEGRSGGAVMDFDWHSLSRFLPAARAPRFDELRRAAGKPGADDADGQDLQALLANHSEEEVREILRQLLTDEIAQILRLPSERIPADRSLYDIGMDSLMAVELALGIEKRFGVNLPLMALSEGPTVARITDRLVRHLVHAEETETLATGEEAHMREVLSGIASQHGVVADSEDLEHAVQELKRQRG